MEFFDRMNDCQLLKKKILVSFFLNDYPSIILH
jgi:hypothetical protein